MTSSSTDEQPLRRALELAREGVGLTSPNPCVGAVLVCKGRIIAQDYHKRAGGPHAEVFVFRKAGQRARGATLYVTMEPCSTYKPWHNKNTGKTYLLPDDGKCLHYYFYFLDEELGLSYVRVPTWLPCRLQIYFNGHNWLAGLLRQLSSKTSESSR